MEVVSGRVETNDAISVKSQRPWYAQPELWLLVLLAIAAH